MNQIGVFDSGLGGLTVVRALRRFLPGESIVYLGDTARVPYGTRAESTVVRYAEGCADLLLAHGVKALVIACILQLTDVPAGETDLQLVRREHTVGW